MKSRFVKSYLIFLSVCVVLSAAFLIYVHSVATGYDKAQPERAVEKQIEWIKAKSADGTLISEIDFNALCSNRYEDNDVAAISQQYMAKFKDAEITYEYNAADSSELSKAYTILADGNAAGRVYLKGSDSRTSLFFFSTADWTVERYEPIIADMVYNLTVYQPDGVDVHINGIAPAPEHLDSSSDIPAYSILGLLNEPEIKYTSTDGTEVAYIADNNTIKPIMYNCEITIPEGISAFIDGKALDGESTGDGRKLYKIREMLAPKITFTDGCGSSITLIDDYELQYNSYSVTLPEDYALSVNGIAAESFCNIQEVAHADAQYLLDMAGVTLVGTKTYRFTLITDEPVIEVTDENGSVSQYVMAQSDLEIGVETLDVIPEEIASQIDVLETAKLWSKFMTDDLEGDYHGLDTVYEILIKDSDYYETAYEWAMGPDIHFTSPHTIDSFTNERVSRFIRHSDVCFSCEVYFEKNISLADIAKEFYGG